MNSRTQKKETNAQPISCCYVLGCGSMKAICLTFLVGHSGVTSPQMTAVWPSNEVLPMVVVQVDFSSKLRKAQSSQTQ